MATRVGRFQNLTDIIADPKTPVRHKVLSDISYTSRVVADFVSNFVAMAT